MLDVPSGGTIEVARGRISDDRAEQLLRFWSERAGLEGPAAEERLSEVVCVLLDGDGAIAGVNSVFARELKLLGGRRFWIYRSFLSPEAAGAATAMVAAAFEALDERFDPRSDDPIGLCLPLGDRAEIEPRREAIWPETGLMVAGYLDDGVQVRVRYFEGAAIGPALPNSPVPAETRETSYRLEDRYSIEPFVESDRVSVDAVLSLWRREGALPEEEARRRVQEVHLVAVEREEGVVGISSAYLRRNPQLRMDLWHYRVFVAREHRMSTLAVLLAVGGRDLLEQRFVSGEDTRAAGMVYEVENEGLKRHLNLARWLRTDFTFIGENARGDHVRVYYFPGARVPLPG